MSVRHRRPPAIVAVLMLAVGCGSPDVDRTADQEVGTAPAARAAGDLAEVPTASPTAESMASTRPLASLSETPTSDNGSAMFCPTLRYGST